MTPQPTIDEQLDDLTPLQRVRLQEAQLAKRLNEDGADGYGRAIVACRDAGLSYGVIGQALGIAKEAIWRREQRYRRRRRRNG